MFGALGWEGSLAGFFDGGASDVETSAFRLLLAFGVLFSTWKLCCVAATAVLILPISDI